jgi:hypothetical protein
MDAASILEVLMAKHHCQCVDGKCDRTIPTPVSGSGGSGPVSISASVGLGGVNRKDDSKKIQIALNNVLEIFGGPAVPLVVDGLPWDKTIKAIRKFQTRQLGWSDGRVDPTGPTLAKLNEQVNTTNFLRSIAQLLGPSPAPGIGVDPKTMDDLYTNLLPVIRFCVLAADATLMLARDQLGGASPSPFGKSAMELVNRHFALAQNPNQNQDFEFIRSIYFDMTVLLNRNNTSPERTFVAFPGKISATALVLGRNAVAVAVAGGRNLKTTTTVTALDGTKITLDDHKIQIFPAFQFEPQDARIATLIHEMSHYLGGPDGATNTIDDHGYGWVDHLTNLSPRLKARNADCFSNFAFDARFHRRPFTFPA